MVLMSGCCMSHDWQEATCTVAKKCTKCEETEGEALEHTWIEATCSVPKTCSICKKTEGEKSEHNLSKANYQQASNCQVCGETVGEPLQAELENSGIANSAVLDRTYDFEMPCDDDLDETTVTKVSFTNYQTFISDDTHSEKDGYEWKTLDINIVVGDPNGLKYGFMVDYYYEDYYYNCDDNEWEKFTVNFNDVDYPCEFYVENGTNGWEKKEQYGWKETMTVLYRIHVLLPEEYDGFIFGLYDSHSNFMDLGDYSGSSEDYIYFRFM